MITASQCRAARGLLDWTQQQLADAARIGVATVRLFESEATETRQATLAVLRQAFEFAGVEFTNGDQPGVRLTKAAAATFRRVLVRRLPDESTGPPKVGPGSCVRRKTPRDVGSPLFCEPSPVYAGEGEPEAEPGARQLARHRTVRTRTGCTGPRGYRQLL